MTIFSMLFIMIASKVYAADENFELQLEASKNTLNPGDSFSVNIIIDNMNITSGDQGIGAYQTKIIYEVGGQAVLGRQHVSRTPWLTERHGYDPT